MNPLVRQILGESSLDEVKQVVVKTRAEEFHACPHCGQEILEKHTFVEGDFMGGNYIERHRDCGGAIKWPPTDWSKINPEWRALLEPKVQMEGLGHGITRYQGCGCTNRCRCGCMDEHVSPDKCPMCKAGVTRR